MSNVELDAQLSTKTLADELPNITDADRFDLLGDLSAGVDAALADHGLFAPGYGNNLYLSKNSIRDLLTCDAKAMSDAPFEPSMPMLEGVIGEIAIRTDWLEGGTIDAAALTAGVIAKLAKRRKFWAQEYIAQFTDEQVQDIATRNVERIQRGRDLMPTLARTTTQATLEKHYRPFLVDGTVVLNGFIDVHLAPRQATHRQTSVHLELKTGQSSVAWKMDEPRLYALLEAITRGATPPQRIGILNVDTGEHQVEEVTVGLLAEQAERIVEAVAREVALTAGLEVTPRACGRSFCEGCNPPQAQAA